ncbi:MAG: hypothetical protein JSS49_08750 [Planctomycetes bacterium]|nr:hypothetical protein [Planctomycetota bacterium]
MTWNCRWSNCLRGVVLAAQTQALIGMTIAGMSLVQPAVGQDSLPTPLTAVPPSPAEIPAETDEERRIGSIVQKYVERLEARQAALEAAHEAQSEQLGGIVIGRTSVAGPAETNTLPPPHFIPMTARWGSGLVDNGLWFSSQDNAYKIHVGGRTQWDMSGFDAPANVQPGHPGGMNNTLNDGTSFRRARLRFEGAYYEQADWCIEYDFVDSTKVTVPNQNPTAFDIPSPRDLWWTFRDTPLGHFRIGNQKEGFGFERLQSSRWLTLMERSFNTEAFYSPFSAGFSPGFQFFDTAFDQRATWAVGAFRNVTNGFVYAINSDDWAFTGRGTILPIYEDKGRRLLHLGVSARHAGINGGVVNYRARGPERAGPSTLWPSYAATGNIYAKTQDDVNFELVSVWGPLSLQAEYNLNLLPDAAVTSGGPGVGTLLYHGGYAEVGCFLTGEHREYIRSAALFNRIVPNENAFYVRKSAHGPLCGLGAWQVAARYNYLNLNSKGINGGILNDVTIGLNWFINSNTKVQWNYSVTDRLSPGPSGSTAGGSLGGSSVIQGYGMRVAHDF